ncbi:MAG TPA: hypothetical protein VG797_10950, partial [Phycisphaerales bacterium]|nr:hypothetical protein [Phycisphaerales bacterium]
MKMNSLVAYASGLALACASHGAVIEVIHTGIAGHPTAHVPGQAAGVEFRGPLAAFLTLYGSPTGNYWFLKAFSNEADAVNEVMILGSGNTSSTVAKEGSASPLAGLNYGFMDSDCGVNDSGAYTFGNRLSAGTTTDEILFKYDTGTSSIVSAVREGDVAPGLTDPSGAGNELFGNSLNSAHILNNGVVRFKADTIQNINTNFRSALYSGLTVLAQEGTPGPTGTYDSFVALSGNTISSDANGAHWIVE